MKKTTRISIQLLFALIIPGLFYMIACARDQVQSQMVGPGIELRVIEVPEVPWQIRAMIVDLKNPYVHLESVKANEHLFSLETTSSMSSRRTYAGHVVVGAVNGDFYVTSGPTMGQPVGTQVSDGQILLKPNWNTAFVVDNSGRPYIDVFTMQAGVLKNGNDVNITAINVTRGENDLILYNGFYGSSTGTNTSGVELLCTYLDSVIFVNDTIYGIVINKLEGTGNADIPENGFVLSGSGAKANFLNENFAAGDTLEYYILFPQVSARINQAVGGGPILIENGEIVVEPGGAIHPRTAVGYNASGDTLILMVVDGRQEGYSAGMTYRELAEYMQELGAYYALNLDGGGSSTMVVRGEVVNSPSDPWGERPVSNNLHVVSSAPLGTVQNLTISPGIERIFRGKNIQFSVNGTDQFYNPLDLTDSIVVWGCSGNIGSITSEGMFTAGKDQDTGWVFCAVNDVSDSLMLIIDTLKFIRVTPSPLVMTTGDSVEIGIDGITTGDSIVDLPEDSVSFEILGSSAEVNQNGVIVALSPGTDTLEVCAYGTCGFAPIYIDIDSLDLLIDDFSDAGSYSLSGTGIHPFFTTICEDTSVFVSAPAALKLKYYFEHTGGSHRIDLKKEIVVPGTISSLSMDVFGNGKGHSIYWVLEDSDGEIFNYYLETSEDWGRQWEHLEKSTMYIIPSFENAGASLDFPITLKSLTIFLGGGVPNQTEIDSLYFDNLAFHYRPLNILETNDKIPDTFNLGYPFPNPFNVNMVLSYGMAKNSRVSIVIFDLQGRIVRRLVDREMGPGLFQVQWDGTNDRNEHISSGVYFISAKSDDRSIVRKVVYLK